MEFQITQIVNRQVRRTVTLEADSEEEALEIFDNDNIDIDEEILIGEVAPDATTIKRVDERRPLPPVIIHHYAYSKPHNISCSQDRFKAMTTTQTLGEVTCPDCLKIARAYYLKNSIASLFQELANRDANTKALFGTTSYAHEHLMQEITAFITELGAFINTEAKAYAWYTPEDAK